MFVRGRETAQRYCGVAGAVIAAVLMAVLPAEGAELKGAVSVEKERVAVGDTVKLLVKVTGGGSADAWRIEQPELPGLRRLSLKGVSQRNEAFFDDGGSRFTVSFLYTLAAEKPGKEDVPAIEVSYSAPGGKGKKTLKLSGIAVEVTPAPGTWTRALAVVAVAAGAGAILIVVGLVRRRRRREPPAPVERKEERDVDAPVVALGRIEDARRLDLEGDRGGYCSEVRAALEDYFGSSGDEEARGLVEGLADLCERVKFAGDEEAGRELDDVVRRALLLLRKRIREQL